MPDVEGGIKKAMDAPMEKARAGLEKFAEERKVDRIGDDLPALESKPQKSEQVTDLYLAALAAQHGLKLATLDERIKHPAAVLVEPVKPCGEAGTRAIEGQLVGAWQHIRVVRSCSEGIARRRRSVFRIKPRSSCASPGGDRR